jgi:hypothetical protein
MSQENNKDIIDILDDVMDYMNHLLREELKSKGHRSDIINAVMGEDKYASKKHTKTSG